MSITLKAPGRKPAATNPNELDQQAVSPDAPPASSLICRHDEESYVNKWSWKRPGIADRLPECLWTRPRLCSCVTSRSVAVGAACHAEVFSFFFSTPLPATKIGSKPTCHFWFDLADPETITSSGFVRASSWWDGHESDTDLSRLEGTFLWFLCLFVCSILAGQTGWKCKWATQVLSCMPSCV